MNLNKPETKLWIQIRSHKQSFEFDFKLKVGSKASISNSNENSGMNLRRWIRRFDFENEAYAKKQIVLLGFHRKEFNISLIKISVPYKTRSLLLRKVELILFGNLFGLVSWPLQLLKTIKDKLNTFQNRLWEKGAANNWEGLPSPLWRLKKCSDLGQKFPGCVHL